MDFTVTLSEKYNIPPFEILRQDKDEVVMLINYFIEKGEDKPQTQTIENNSGRTEKRVRVNDRTATGGWF